MRVLLSLVLERCVYANMRRASIGNLVAINKVYTKMHKVVDVIKIDTEICSIEIERIYSGH